MKIKLSGCLAALFTILTLSQCNQRNGYTEENSGGGAHDTAGVEKTTYDTTGGVSEVAADSTASSNEASDTTHLDENLDQRGTRIKAGEDPKGKKE